MQRVRIDTRFGPVTVRACRVAGGLALTRVDVGWSITHIASGRAVISGLTRAAARRLIGDVAALTDWTRPREAIKEDIGLASAVAKLRAQER